MDLDKGTIQIHGKGRRERSLPIPPDLAELISNWRRHLRPKLSGAQHLAALFVSKKGKPRTGHADTDAFTPQTESAREHRAGQEHYSPMTKLSRSQVLPWPPRRRSAASEVADSVNRRPRLQ